MYFIAFQTDTDFKSKQQFIKSIVDIMFELITTYKYEYFPKPWKHKYLYYTMGYSRRACVDCT